MIFYVIAIFVVTLLVPSNDPSLLSPSGQGAAQSPFVIAGSCSSISTVWIILAHALKLK